MARTNRAGAGGLCYHVSNRGNALQDVFHDPDDFAEFAQLLGEACERHPMRLLAWCAMPSHFHLVVWPRKEGDLSRWMQWLTNSHVRRHHSKHRTFGHIWQGRFKDFPIQPDDHLLAVMRYVEQNPLRAKLTKRAEDWAWSSAARSPGGDFPALDPAPVERPRTWRALLNRPFGEVELAVLRNSLKRGAPYGDVKWQQRTAEKLSLQSTLNPRGRPRVRPAK